MLIDGIDESRLSDDGRAVSVAIIDSGFSRMPSYATMHGANGMAGAVHGSRILSIFTAFDKSHPIANMTLHLSCYNPMTGYEGLKTAIRILPECDILSISMSWKDDSVEIRSMLRDKFKTVCVPYSANTSLLYPASYEFTTTCSNLFNQMADYCIQPNPEWRGNSYAVPAVARLFAHGYFDRDSSTDEARIVKPVQDEFAECRNGITVKEDAGSHAGIMICPSCHRYMRSRKTNGLIVLDTGTPCPYCGHIL